MNYKKRITRVQKLLSLNKLDAFLVTNPSNIFYLTGFRGVSPLERETTALIDKNGLTFFSPKLYQEEAKKLSRQNGFESVIVSEISSLLTEPLRKMSRFVAIGVEADNIRLSEYNLLVKISKTKIITTDNIVENLRLVKDREEIDLVKYAVKITDNVFTQIKNELKPGLTEKQIARRLTELMEEMGADGPSFEPIVASGINSSFPHYVASNNKIKKGILLIDAGAQYKGYCADLTRTFYLGKPKAEFIKYYKKLLSVQERSIKYTKQGVEEERLWQRSVKLLGKDAEYFTHGLGHGIGIDVHEPPYLKKGYNQPLKANILVTIEPGLYFPNWGGIRIEDFLLVTDKGNTVLSNSPKEIQDIIIH